MSTPHGTTLHEIRSGTRAWSRLWASKAMHLGHSSSVRCYEASNPRQAPLWGHDFGSGKKHHGVRTAGQVRQPSIGLAGLTCLGSLWHTSLQMGIHFLQGRPCFAREGPCRHSRGA